MGRPSEPYSADIQRWHHPPQVPEHGKKSDQELTPCQTPAQPPFLLPKAQKQKSATPLQSGPHQFASTPRFNTSKTTSRQETVSHRPPPFSTPAPPIARVRATQYDPTSDIIDTSPISSDLSHNGVRRRLSLDESIEIESQSPLASPNESEDERKVERPTKRRRMSVSPVLDAAPEEDEIHDLMALDNVQIEFNDTNSDQDHPTSVLEPRLDSEDTPSPVGPSTRHPTFLSAPRFKTTEAPEADNKPPSLPEAFSPQRRGAKYVSGGLAAEVRDWLVQVKGASEYDRPAGESVRLVVDQVRHPTYGGIHLIAGAEVEGGNEVAAPQEHTEAGKEQPPRVLLAGDGRIPGLGRRTVVSPGVAVAMYQPMWDIALKDLGRFAVACDWEGEDQES